MASLLPDSLDGIEQSPEDRKSDLMRIMKLYNDEKETLSPEEAEKNRQARLSLHASKYKQNSSPTNKAGLPVMEVNDSDTADFDAAGEEPAAATKPVGFVGPPPVMSKVALGDEEEKKQEAPIVKPKTYGVNFPDTDYLTKKHNELSGEMDKALKTVSDEKKKQTEEANKAYQGIMNRADILREKIDSIQGEERKQLAYERLGDMVARALANLGAGIQSANETKAGGAPISVKPLNLEPVSQAERYADLANRAKSGELAAESQEKRGAQILKNALQQAEDAEKYGTAAASRKFQYGIHAAETDYKAKMDKAAALQRLEEKKQDAARAKQDKTVEKLYNIGQESINKEVGALNTRLKNMEKQYEDLNKPLKTYKKVGELMTSNGITQADIDRKKEELKGEDWSSPSDMEAATQLVADRREAAKKNLQQKADALQSRKEELEQTSPLNKITLSDARSLGLDESHPLVKELISRGSAPQPVPGKQVGVSPITKIINGVEWEKREDGKWYKKGE